VQQHGARTIGASSSGSEASTLDRNVLCLFAASMLRRAGGG